MHACSHNDSQKSAQNAPQKSIKIGSKDNQLFPIERIEVAKIQGPINTRQNWSRVDAALKENVEFFVLFKVCGPLAQAISRSQSKELKFFKQAQDWTADQPVDSLA